MPRSLADEEDFRLIIAIFPVLWSLSDDDPFASIHESISDFAEELRVPLLDLRPAFEGYVGPELWVHPNNQHPNRTSRLRPKGRQRQSGCRS